MPENKAHVQDLNVVIHGTKQFMCYFHKQQIYISCNAPSPVTALPKADYRASPQALLAFQLVNVAYARPGFGEVLFGIINRSDNAGPGNCHFHFGQGSSHHKGKPAKKDPRNGGLIPYSGEQSQINCGGKTYIGNADSTSKPMLSQCRSSAHGRWLYQ